MCIGCLLLDIYGGHWRVGVSWLQVMVTLNADSKRYFYENLGDCFINSKRSMCVISPVTSVGAK